MTDHLLITGGSGFIGQHTVDVALAAGFRVTVLDRRRSSQAGIRYIQGSVMDQDLVRELVAETDCVVHLAAIADVSECERNPEESYTVNVEGSTNVLRAAKQAGGRRVVIASSASVYGGAGPFHETAPKKPDSTYARTKWAMEQFARAGDSNVCILRYFSVYGQGQLPKPDSFSWPVATFCVRALQGEPLLVHGEGLQTRDFVNVKDVAAATIAGCLSEATGVMNIGTGVGTSILDLARLVQTSVPGTQISVGAPRPEHDPWGGAGVIERARELLCWTPKVDLMSGLESYIGWLREHV
ncbi:MAG: epimerase [Brachybacterium faecium]|nr:MAG: epimerase [Brachybacterium faecium]